MKKLTAMLLAAAMIVCLLSGCGYGTSDNSANTSGGNTGTGNSAAVIDSEDFPSITLTFSASRAENHYFNDYNDWLFDELKNQANITIEPYYSNTLVGATTPYAEVKDGVADIAWISSGTETDHFNIAGNVMYFMWGCSDNTILKDAWTEAFNEISEWNGQYEGVKVLGLHNAGNQGVVTIDQVTKIDDFKGMVIRGTNTQTSLIEALGAENLSVASTEVLANMEKGTLDGAMGVGTITGFSLLEFCHSVVYLDIMSGYEPQFLMNEKSWNGLTSAQQEIVADLFDELCTKIAGSFDQWDQNALDAGIEAGMTLNTFSTEEQAKLQGIAYELAMDGIKQLNSLGYDGQAIYDTCRDALTRCCEAAGYQITELS